MARVTARSKTWGGHERKLSLTDICKMREEGSLSRQALVVKVASTRLHGRSPTLSLVSPPSAMSTTADGADGPVLTDALLDGESQGSLGTGSAIFSIISALLGTGLAVPFAFAEVDPLWGAASLAFVAMVVNYGVSLVTTALSSPQCVKIAIAEGIPPESRELSFLAFCAFQTTGRLVVTVILSLELWFALLVGFVSIGVHGALLSQGLLSQGAVIAITAVVTYPLMEAPSWLLGGAGLLCCVGCLLCSGVFVGTALATLPATHNLLSDNSTGPPSWVGLVSCTGIMFYNYGNAACLPPIRAEMAAPGSFPRVVRLSMVLSILFYGALGIMGTRFGKSIGQSYLENISQPFAQGAACSAVVVSMLLVLPLLTKPILLACLPILGAKSGARVAGFKVVFMVVSTVSAIFLQDSLAAVSGLTGASLTMGTCVLVPAFLYWKIMSPGLAERIVLATMIAFGLLFSVVGTYEAAKDIFDGKGAVG